MIKTKSVKKLLSISFCVITFLICSVYFPVKTLAATTSWYVSATGSDTNNGTSASTPFKTLQKGSDATNPGDTVNIMNGTYYYNGGDNLLKITRSGTSSAYITYQAYIGATPILRTDNANAHICVYGAAYIKIIGLTIQGYNANITYAQAFAQKDNITNNPYNIYGIGVYKDYLGNNPHHIEISQCTIYDCPAGGIQVSESDYITITSNSIFGNCLYSNQAPSGISLFHSYDTDTNTTGYKNYINNNTVHDNKCLIPWSVTKSLSDGNGIIIDDNKNTQIGATPYNGKTYVFNNVSYLNGGSGIHAFYSSNVDIINNTAYNNSQQLNYGEIYAIYSTNCNLINNILYAKTNCYSTREYSNTNVGYDYNLIYNDPSPQRIGPHDILNQDPCFINASAGNFSISSTSPAINKATSWLAPTYDKIGTARPQGGGYDIGAYEFK